MKKMILLVATVASIALAAPATAQTPTPSGLAIATAPPATLHYLKPGETFTLRTRHASSVDVLTWRGEQFATAQTVGRKIRWSGDGNVAVMGTPRPFVAQFKARRSNGSPLIVAVYRATR